MRAGFAGREDGGRSAQSIRPARRGDQRAHRLNRGRNAWQAEAHGDPYLAVGPKERGTLGQFAEKIFENQRQPPRGIARMLRQTELRILGCALG